MVVVYYISYKSTDYKTSEKEMFIIQSILNDKSFIESKNKLYV